jgi:hypothetical protein
MDSRPILPARPSRSMLIAYLVISELLILRISYVSTNRIVSLLESEADYQDKASLQTTVMVLAVALGISASLVFRICRLTARAIAATTVSCAVAVFDSLCVVGVFPVANGFVSLFNLPITIIVMGTLFLHPTKPIRIAYLCVTCLVLLSLLTGVLSIADEIAFESQPSSRLRLRIWIVSMRMMELSLIWNGAILFFTVAKLNATRIPRTVHRSS